MGQAPAWGGTEELLIRHSGLQSEWRLGCWGQGEGRVGEGLPIGSLGTGQEGAEAGGELWKAVGRSEVPCQGA